jgi:hypothetical protein
LIAGCPLGSPGLFVAGLTCRGSGVVKSGSSPSRRLFRIPCVRTVTREGRLGGGGGLSREVGGGGDGVPPESRACLAGDSSLGCAENRSIQVSTMWLFS